MKGLNKLAALIVLLFAFATNLTAGQTTNETFIKRAKINFLHSMNSEYNSIVESSIFISMDMKKRFPNEDYDIFIDKLNDLAIEGRTPTVRYKAQLASLYFNFFNMFSDITIDSKSNPEIFFKSIADRLSDNNIVAK